jgi:hypothetical protein
VLGSNGVLLIGAPIFEELVVDLAALNAVY